MLVITSTYAIDQEVVNAFPQECCGFLLGKENDDVRNVVTVYPCENISSRKNTAFCISSHDYLAAEHYAEINQLDLLGIYHSHPNSPAEPSAADLASALPNFSYLIISIYHKNVKDWQSWRLNEDSIFEKEITFTNKTFSKKTAAWQR